MLTVSIVTFRTPSDELRKVLSCLDTDAVSHVFVIDNSGDAATRAVCEAAGPKVNYSALPNPGYGAAHNTAIRRALEMGADYHLVLNSDIIFAPDDLRRLVEVMDANPEVGALQPRIVNPDGRLQYTVRRLPTPFDLFIRRFLPSRLIAGRTARYELHDLDHDRAFNVPYHQGSFMLLRTEALRECGLFDERFFMYPEDIDLTRRIHRRYMTLYYPEVTVIHAHRRGSYHSLRLLAIHCVNMARYFGKWGWFIDPERRRFNRSIEYADVRKNA